MGKEADTKQNNRSVITLVSTCKSDGCIRQKLSRSKGFGSDLATSEDSTPVEMNSQKNAVLNLDLTTSEGSTPVEMDSRNNKGLNLDLTTTKETTTVDYEINCTYVETFLQKQRWTQNAVAKHICADRKTIKIYAEKLAIVVPDYLKECPRNPDGSIVSSFPLSAYQAWVLIHLINLGREIRKDLNGLSTHKILKSAVIKRLDYLTKAAWQACQDEWHLVKCDRQASSLP